MQQGRRRRRRQPPSAWPRVAGALIILAVAASAVWLAGRDSPREPDGLAQIGISTPASTAPTISRADATTPGLTSTPGATSSPEPAFPPGPVTPVPPMPTPVTVARSSRYSPVPFVPDPQLSAQVLQRLAGGSGRRGIAIKDLDTGRGVLIDPDGEYEAASLFKLPVMFETFKQRDLGVVSFDEILVFTARHVAYDLGTLDRGVGATIGLEEALERMITVSDNSSAILLTDRVGAFNINQDMRGLGLEHTRVLLDDLSTSPADMLLFLEMLARGQGVSPAASAEMIQLMARQRIRDRIPRFLPPDATVANKTGNLPGVVNDVGIVYGPDATFVIAVLIDGTTDEAEAARTTADIASAAYEYFRGVHTDGPTTLLPTAAPLPTPRPTSPPTVTLDTTPTPLPTAARSPVETATLPASPPTAAATPEPTNTLAGTASPAVQASPTPTAAGAPQSLGAATVTVTPGVTRPAATPPPGRAITTSPTATIRP